MYSWGQPMNFMSYAPQPHGYMNPPVPQPASFPHLGILNSVPISSSSVMSPQPPSVYTPVIHSNQIPQQRQSPFTPTHSPPNNYTVSASDRNTAPTPISYYGSNVMPRSNLHNDPNQHSPVEVPSINHSEHGNDVVESGGKTFLHVHHKTKNYDNWLDVDDLKDPKKHKKWNILNEKYRKQLEDHHKERVENRKQTTEIHSHDILSRNLHAATLSLTKESTEHNKIKQRILDLARIMGVSTQSNSHQRLDNAHIHSILDTLHQMVVQRVGFHIQHGPMKPPGIVHSMGFNAHDINPLYTTMNSPNPNSHGASLPTEKHDLPAIVPDSSLQIGKVHSNVDDHYTKTLEPSLALAHVKQQTQNPVNITEQLHNLRLKVHPSVPEFWFNSRLVNPQHSLNYTEDKK